MFIHMAVQRKFKFHHSVTRWAAGSSATAPPPVLSPNNILRLIAFSFPLEIFRRAYKFFFFLILYFTNNCVSRNCSSCGVHTIRALAPIISRLGCCYSLYLLYIARTRAICQCDLYYCVHKVKLKFALEQTTKAQTGSRGIALLFS
jgi:hypothetical protein